MSARLFNCFTDAQDNAVFSAIGLRELHTIMEMEPSSTTKYWFQVNAMKRKQEHEEHVAQLRYKYNYLLCQIEWIFDGNRYDYVREQFGLPEDYVLQFEEAVQWYQLSQHYYEEHGIAVQCNRTLFIRKWLELHPDDAAHVTTLEKELQLSDEALRILYQKSPKGDHPDMMYILCSTNVELLTDLIPSLEDIEDVNRITTTSMILQFED